MPTFEQRTGIGKPPRRRQKPVVAAPQPGPVGHVPTPTPQIATSPAVEHHAAVQVIHHLVTGGLTHLPQPRTVGYAFHHLTDSEKATYGPLLLHRYVHFAGSPPEVLRRYEGTGPAPKAPQLRQGKAFAAQQGEQTQAISQKLTQQQIKAQPGAPVTQIRRQQRRFQRAFTPHTVRHGITSHELGLAGQIALAAVPGGAAVDALRLGGRAVEALRGGKAVEEVARAGRGADIISKAEKAAKGEKALTPAAEAGRVGRALGRGVGRGARRLARPAKAAAFGATHPRYALNALPLAAKGKAVALGASSAGASVPVVTSLAQGTKNEALGFVHDPLKTLATTARVAEATPAALVGVAADAARGNFKGILNQQGRYYGQYGKLLGTNSKQAERVVQNQLGLVPAATAGLTGLALTRAVLRTRPGAALGERVRTGAEALTPDRHDALVGRAAAGDARATRRLASGAEREQIAPRHGRRRTEAIRRGVGEQGQRLHEHREYTQHSGRKAKRVGAREDYRKLVERLARRPIGDTGISYAHVIQPAVQLGLRHDVPDLIGHIRAAVAALPDHSTVQARTLLAMLQHPEVLHDAELHRALEATPAITQGRALEHSELGGGARTSLDRNFERSANQSQMRHLGVLTDAERIPHELRGTVKVRERPGHDAEKAIRGSANAMVRRAGRLRVAAETVARNDPAIMKLVKAEKSIRAKAVLDKGLDPETRGELLDRAASLREQIAARIENHPRRLALRDRANSYTDEANRRLAITDRSKRARGLERKAAKAEVAGDPVAAEELRAQAADLYASHERSLQARHQESMQELAARREQAGLHPAGYVPQSPAGREFFSVSGQPFARAVKKLRFKSGGLEAKGLVDYTPETLLRNMALGRADITNRGIEQSFLSEVPQVYGGRRFFSQPEIVALRKRGAVPPGTVAVRASEFAGSIDRSPFRDEWRQTSDRAKLTRTPQVRSEVYFLAHESSWNQYRALRDFTRGIAGKGVSALYRAQTFAMLATSPTWWAFQLPALPLSVIARNLSPARYVRTADFAIRDWAKISPHDRASWQAIFGANPGDLIRIGTEALTPARIDEMMRTGLIAEQSPLGRFARAIGREIQAGGPLIQTNRAIEGRIRQFASLMELDRATGLTREGTPTVTSRAVRFIEHTIGAQQSVYFLQDKLRGLPRDQWVGEVLRDRPAMAELQDRLNNALGEWASMTDFERRLSSVVAFYPFLRYSLRWMLYGFPKDNPLKAAALINLAQSNSVELQHALKGSPSYLQGYGQIVTHNAAGEPAGLINLARSGPGGNAVFEGLSNGQIDLQALFSPTPPLIGGSLLALAGQSSSGSPSTANVGQLELKNLATLSPLSRPLAYKIGPQSSIAALYRAMGGTPTSLPGTLVPQITPSLEGQRDSVLLSKALTKGDEATVKRLFHKYHVPDVQQPYQITIDPKKSSSGGGDSSGVPWAGSGSGGGGSSGVPWAQ